MVLSDGVRSTWLRLGSRMLALLHALSTQASPPSLPSWTRTDHGLGSRLLRFLLFFVSSGLLLPRARGLGLDTGVGSWGKQREDGDPTEGKGGGMGSQRHEHGGEGGAGPPFLAQKALGLFPPGVPAG